MLTIHPSRDFCFGVEISHNGRFDNLLKELQFLFSIQIPLRTALTVHDLRARDIFPIEIKCFYIFILRKNKLYVHPGLVWQLCKQLGLKYSKKAVQNFIDDQNQYSCKNIDFDCIATYLHISDVCKQKLVELPLKVIAEPPGLKRAQLEMVWEMSLLEKNRFDLIVARL